MSDYVLLSKRYEEFFKSVNTMIKARWSIESEDEYIFGGNDDFMESVIQSAWKQVLLEAGMTDFNTEFSLIVSNDLKEIIVDVSLAIARRTRKEGLKSDGFETQKTEFTSDVVQPYRARIRTYSAMKGIASRTFAFT